VFVDCKSGEYGMEDRWQDDDWAASLQPRRKKELWRDDNDMVLK